MTPLLTFLCFLATTLIGRGIFNEPRVSMFRPPSPSGSDPLLSKVDELEGFLKNLENDRKQEENNQFDYRLENQKRMNDINDQLAEDRKKDRIIWEKKQSEDFHKLSEAEREKIEIERSQNLYHTDSLYLDSEDETRRLDIKINESEERVSIIDREMTETHKNIKRLQDLRKIEIENKRNLEKIRHTIPADKMKALEEIEKQEKEAHEHLKRIQDMKKQEIKNQDDYKQENHERVKDLEKYLEENRKDRDSLWKKMDSGDFRKLPEAERKKTEEDFHRYLNSREDQAKNYSAQLDESMRKIFALEEQESEAQENFKRLQGLKKEEIELLKNFAKS